MNSVTASGESSDDTAEAVVDCDKESCDCDGCVGWRKGSSAPACDDRLVRTNLEGCILPFFGLVLPDKSNGSLSSLSRLRFVEVADTFFAVAVASATQKD